jgi:hypothetical protein
VCVCVCVLCTSYQVGEVGNFLAYGWAPATLVAPLGSFSVVSNAILVRTLYQFISLNNYVCM